MSHALTCSVLLLYTMILCELRFLKLVGGHVRPYCACYIILWHLWIKYCDLLLFRNNSEIMGYFRNLLVRVISPTQGFYHAKLTVVDPVLQHSYTATALKMRSH